MSKVLNLTFRATDGKTHSMTIANPIENLDQATVEAMMDQLIAADAIYDDQVKLFNEKVGARYVETIASPIFEVTGK
ncbi:DUF2922 domain-containing protein [Vaginisenegalia massiliensis]|uniref:DUF2922 domain-containing protein n=1 Tax=Vaginisenegalia massiliensis TaxID=2058294 RepID=UPI000F52B623|nr:DUF2922 domain-containing protein [Vaginisenegalia massiliensis]